MRDMPTLDWMLDDQDPATDPVEERYQELAERRIHNAWAWLLSSEEGRLVAWTILDHCHVFSTTFTGNASSTFLEGERSVGLKVLKGHILPQGNHLLGVLMDEAEARHHELMAAAEAQTYGETDDRADD